ncbi:MAG: hypothetical protein ACREBG_29285 [Pyrinomonadaceae bacterium]
MTRFGVSRSTGRLLPSDAWIKVLAVTLFLGSFYETRLSATSFYQSSTPSTPDLTRLRTSFTEAFGYDFELVRDELKQRSKTQGGGTHWLAFVRPKRSGYFGLQYRYKSHDSNYSHVEREFYLRIGERGCRRGPPQLGSYTRFCLGDTIIIPIALDNFTEHQFGLSSSRYTPADDRTFDEEYPEWAEQELDRSQISNPISEHLRYIGRGSHKMLHHNGGYTLETYAVFKAEKPGRFNLALSVPLQGSSATLASEMGASESVPVVVVARETPVTLIASRQEVRGYRMDYDGREWVSSNSGNSYATELMILQPGDRISLTYQTIVRSREYERNERNSSVREESIPPAVTRLPFAARARYDFTDWLIDYLPR